MKNKKQETIEKATKKFPKGDYKDGLIDGANWQAERMYSEEEMLEFGKYLLELANSAMLKRTNIKMLDLKTGRKLLKDLFEQFKKK